jgi:type IV pilus assembly protein PilV
MSRTACNARRRSAGFSLVEVMVALVVCAIGMLGLAKMESLALSSTGVASSRSLAAIQASSMASAMHADRGYWGAGLAPAVTIVNEIPPTPSNFSAAVPCLTPGTASCTVNAQAAYDLQQWAIALNALLPGYNATITCSTAGFPVNCTIQIQWIENAVSSNAQQTGMANLQAPTYVLYVEP